MSAASGSRSARWAHDVVIDWTLLFTRGLPARVADDRFREIVSDLWEQGAAADRRGGSGLRLAVDVLLRAAAGVPADLMWRREVLAETAPAFGPKSVQAPKAWVPLTPIKPFDQTNGAVTFGTDGPQHGGKNVERDLLELGIAANAAAGFSGGTS